MPRQRGARHPLTRARIAVHKQKQANTKFLRSAVVGRPLELPRESFIMSAISRAAGGDVRYISLGQRALVYLHRQELRASKGDTYYNPTQVTQAISELGSNLQRGVVIARSELSIISRPAHVSEKGTQYHWLYARGMDARYVSDERRMDMQREELKLAGNLLRADETLSDTPIMWLGAVAAPDRATAEQALEPLESILPIAVRAGAVALLPLGQASRPQWWT